MRHWLLHVLKELEKTDPGDAMFEVQTMREIRNGVAAESKETGSNLKIDYEMPSLSELLEIL